MRQPSGHNWCKSGGDHVNFSREELVHNWWYMQGEITWIFSRVFLVKKFFKYSLVPLDKIWWIFGELLVLFSLKFILDFGGNLVGFFVGFWWKFGYFYFWWYFGGILVIFYFWGYFGGILVIFYFWGYFGGILVIFYFWGYFGGNLVIFIWNYSFVSFKYIYVIHLSR